MLTEEELNDYADDWVRCRSNQHDTTREYWFNQRNGLSFWCNDNIFKQMNDIDDKIAIIVPFRDNQPAQHRRQQLDQFIPAISKFLLLAEIPFKIFIIEQSNDGRKFNRGKLLNVGYALAVNQGYTIHVFHDVDLIPSNDLIQHYAVKPRQQPVHIARVWNRYNLNEKYFGGIVTFSKELFEEINGYPNTFWGWGGEDDELYKRVVRRQLNIAAPRQGSIYDMEQMDLQTKLKFLKEHEDIKCMNRNELLAEHAATWNKNGLCSFKEKVEFKVQRRRYHGNDFCVIYTVDLALNGGHWSDARCGEHDKQY